MSNVSHLPSLSHGWVDFTSQSSNVPSLSRSWTTWATLLLLLLKAFAQWPATSRKCSNWRSKWLAIFAASLVSQTSIANLSKTMLRLFNLWTSICAKMRDLQNLYLLMSLEQSTRSRKCSAATLSYEIPTSHCLSFLRRMVVLKALVQFSNKCMMTANASSLMHHQGLWHHKEV